jgi:hypothetical protein
MQNSIEALLSRHYGDTAQTPVGLEERLLASIRQKTEELREGQQLTTRLQQKRLSRRGAFKLFARGTARVGLDALNAGLDSLQILESALTT